MPVPQSCCEDAKARDGLSVEWKPRGRKPCFERATGWAAGPFKAPSPALTKHGEHHPGQPLPEQGELGEEQPAASTHGGPDTPD